MSSNLVGIDTAAAEMKALEFFNPRCNDAVFHYELAWPPGERPSRAEWTDAGLHTLNQLGFKEHQYVLVAHDDRKHFHIHVMVNKVHPETYRAHTPSFSWLTLDAAARSLEAKYGWSHTPGPMRWDEDTQQAVRASKSEREAARSARQMPTGGAAKLEHYHDEESLQSYVRKEVAPRVRTLLARRNPSWDDLHAHLAKLHLRMEKGEAGGYTILAIDYNIRVKASDVFRNNFAGKVSRQTTEAALGPWRPSSISSQETAQHSVRTPVRNSSLREERKAQRQAERSALMADYNQYRNQQREVCKAYTTDGRESRQHLLEVLRQQKREIRASALSWPAKKVLLSQATAQSVLEVRALKVSIQQRRQAAFPKDLRSWVADRASEGDARAAAQLRGWRYADQRNQRRIDSTLESNALHLSPASEQNSEDWNEIIEQRLAAQQRAQNLAAQIATTRIWTINRATGDVSYMLKGRLAVIDHGRRVTVLNHDEAAIVFGLEMAVQKYGPHIACSGNIEWKRQVVKAAVQNGIFVEFTDPDIQSAVRNQQRLANPLQIKAARLQSLEDRLQNEESNELLFTNEADVLLLLSCVQSAAHAQHLLDILKTAQEPEPKAKIAGNLTVAVLRASDGRWAFKVSINEGTLKHVRERIAHVRQSAQWAVQHRFNTHGHEREGR